MFIGYIITFAVFATVSLCLLIVGGVCYYTKNSGIKLGPESCENVYVSGLIMSGLVVVAFFFRILKYIADSFELLPAKSHIVVKK